LDRIRGRDGVTSINARASASLGIRRRRRETANAESGADIDTSADPKDRAVDTPTRKPAHIGRLPRFDPALERPIQTPRALPGTVVISITRSGRRPWPGQYALPYIR
jgi:hypothetical protein